jgi:addiction module RelE/StbE family toxin
MYKLRYTKTFEKSMKKFSKSKDVLNEIYAKIKNIQKDTEKGKDLKGKLIGHKSARVKRKFRLIFKINNLAEEIILISFGHRKEIYDLILMLLKKGKL